MMDKFTMVLYNRLPAWAAETLIANRRGRDVLRRMVRGRDVIMRMGLGSGLWFNCSLSNPDYAFGNNELAVQEAFRSHLRPGDVLFDIGANVGFFTIISVQLVGSEGHVYAFEPVPDNAAAVRHNLELNSFTNATVINSAVADRSGQGELLVAHYSGGSALSTVKTPPPDLKERMPVETVSIDVLLAEGAMRPPDMVKIDVEGAELTVLQGMVETIRQHRPVILYEIDDEEAAEFERKSLICSQFLDDFGYQVVPLAESYPNIGWYVGHFLATYAKVPGI